LRYIGFEFRNFKGIEHMVLDLDGDVTTLIGLNESGKTTILEAIFCFSYGREDLEVINPEMASLRVPDSWVPIARRANFNDDIVVSATVELDEGDKAALARHMSTEHKLRLDKVQSRLTIRETYHFEHSRHTGTTSRTWSLGISGTTGRERKPRSYGGGTTEWHAAVDFLKDRLPRIWYFPNFLFELPERFALTDDADEGQEARDKSHFYRSTFEQVLEELGVDADLETHVVGRIPSDDRADQRSLRALLLEMSRVMTHTVFDGWNRIFGRQPTAQEVELEAVEEDGSAFLELRIKGPDGYYDLSERSLGFRWFFMFLLMTSFNGLRKEGPRPLFLLDEPASNLHSTAQAELLKSFGKLADRCHLVYTTHSHHLIDVRWLNSAYVVKNEALGEAVGQDYFTVRIGARTSISAAKYRAFVAEHPDQTTFFQPVLDLLDYRPSVLEPMPDVVLVEGKSDFYLLRYASEVLGLPDEGLHLVPSGGAGSFEALIQLHLGWGRTFVVLLDGDKEGLKQKERYERNFGPVLDGCCHLLPELCGDSAIVEIENLLTNADRARLIGTVFGSSGATPKPKKALHQAIMELYARREAVELDDETVVRITDLIKELRDRVGAGLTRKV
jgi:ABC-type Mn2+/Zn2+ transport system ATPase subunit